ncbi:MAG: peptide-methionine (S)-S-oxide reductase MsrA [Betaproteobacteria bacterium]|nr:peptide-methionine (S)-S-oxide reductase MsrA [Betaproteobacteria bacterium]
MNKKLETASLAGGCFWCIEAVFNELIGVETAISGYMGGANPNPSYEQVCRGSSGHAEIVQVSYDPAIISFSEILEVFFAIHDPTTLNRQGNDVGSQYRSAIFYHDEAQQRTAQQVIERLNQAQLWDKPIVTEITPASVFYPAEEYHQHYFKRNPGQGYCVAVVSPKVAKFRKNFVGKLKSA